MKINDMTFREVGGKWLRVDSREQNPPTLADTLNELSIIIDEHTQFCRIVRYYDNYKEEIIYRAYTMSKITIEVHRFYYD